MAKASAKTSGTAATGAGAAAGAATIGPAQPGRENLHDALVRGAAILLDGAMGTQLYAKGAFINRAFEELNLTRPALVREVHEAYLAAGADLLETNTFAANRFALSPHGLADKVETINRKGVEIAREAAAGRAWVAGAMGPIGARIEPFGPLARDEARAIFAEQAKALVGAGVDAIVLETFVQLPELEEAIRAVREVSTVPVLACIAVGTGGVTRDGVPAGEAATRMAAAGADAVGANCSDALATLDALAAMRAAVSLPLLGQPNAGQPRMVDGRNIYLASPEYLVAWGRRAIRQGARLLGGCCGTTPAHIRALRSVLGEAGPDTPAAAVARAPGRAPAAHPVPREARSRLAAKLAAGSFVTAVEVTPPPGWVPDALVAAGRRLAEAGVDCLSLPEGDRTGARLPPFAVAALARTVAGVEPLVHYVCRERRLSRIQSDLLGAYATGVANVLLLTGDPVSAGADARPDLDVDSIGAVNLVNRLNHGEDIGGNPFGAPTGFLVGVRLDTTHHDVDSELSRWRWKVEAGADYGITSPVFDVPALKAMLARLPGPKVPVLATIWPLTSARQAEFFEQGMASVPIPAPLVERMRKAEARGTEAAEGLAIARELAAAIRPLVQGLHVVAPDGDVVTALAVLDG